jgi:hypothetical protein
MIIKTPPTGSGIDCCFV